MASRSCGGCLSPPVPVPACPWWWSFTVALIDPCLICLLCPGLSLRALRHTTKRQIADEPGSCHMTFQGDGRLGSVPKVLLDASVSVQAPASSTVPGVRMWSVRMPRLHPEDPGGGYRWARHYSCHGQRAADADEEPAASLERAAD